VIERYLDKAIAVEKMPGVEQPIVKIDAEKLASLQQESEYVRRALMIEENHTAEDEDANNASSQAPMEIQNSTDEAERDAERAEESNQPEVGFEGALKTDGVQENRNNEPVSLQWESDFSADLDEEWLQFSEMLSPQHVQAIYALLGVKPDSELMRVAEQYGTMPALLLDEINDVAMETIGDLLIDGDRIVSDYMNVFEHVKR
jgi:hypothetical protein